MNRINFLFVLFILTSWMPSSLSAQVFVPALTNQFTAFDTNGKVGECLFPKDNKMQEVVTVEMSKAQIIDWFKAWEHLTSTVDPKRMKINHFESTESQITFDMQLYIGSTVVDIPWVGLVTKHYSEVKFKSLVEVKDNKYRITFFDFKTDRVTIPGEAKSNGPSNLIHWQRVNSLTMERNEVIGGKQKLSEKKQKKVDEYNKRIKMETDIYKLEWQTVVNVMNQLKSANKQEDDF